MALLDSSIISDTGDRYFDSGTANVTETATLLTTYGNLETVVGKLHGNHADAVLSSIERATDRKCR